MNQLKEMGQAVAWNLLVKAALKGAEERGYSLTRQPGRGLSNTYAVTKDGQTSIACIRTTRDRWIAFPPLEGGSRWKTLDDVDQVLVAAVDNRENPKNAEIHLIPADVVRKRFDASYAARMTHGHTVRDNYGMWVMLDEGDDNVPTQVGHSLAIDYPAIAQFSIAELADELGITAHEEEEAELRGVSETQGDPAAFSPAVSTVAEVLDFARQRIADLTGIDKDKISLDLKMGV